MYVCKPHYFYGCRDISNFLSTAIGSKAKALLNELTLHPLIKLADAGTLKLQFYL